MVLNDRTNRISHPMACERGELMPRKLHVDWRSWALSAKHLFSCIPCGGDRICIRWARACRRDLRRGADVLKQIALQPLQPYALICSVLINCEDDAAGLCNDDFAGHLSDHTRALQVVSLRRDVRRRALALLVLELGDGEWRGLLTALCTGGTASQQRQRRCRTCGTA